MAETLQDRESGAGEESKNERREAETKGAYDLIQLHFRIKRGLPEPTKRDLETVSRRWLDTGEVPYGYHIGATEWGQPHATRDDIKRVTRFGNLCPGKVSHFHKSNVSLCDFDAPSRPSLMRVWEVARTLGIEPIAIELKRSSSGKGWHMIVTWNRDFSHTGTVYLQYLLGSDPKRESFNLQRVLSGGTEGRDDWNILFERKVK
jgi:hypothetical protein